MKFIVSIWLAAVLLILTTNVNADNENQTLPKLAEPFIAPDFILKGEDGNTYRLKDYRGKVVILNFWATWCPPCREEMPSMERAWHQIKDKGIVMLGINVGEDADTIFEFTGQYPMTFPLPMDINGKVVKQYPIRGLPTTYIIDPAGMATHRAVGSRAWDAPEILQQLEELKTKSR